MLSARAALRHVDYLSAICIHARYPVIQSDIIFAERLDTLAGLLYVYIVYRRMGFFRTVFLGEILVDKENAK